MTGRTAAHSLDHLFRPQSVALVGASRNPGSMSGVLLRNLQEKFQGPIYPVNPFVKQIGSLPAYPTIAAIQAPVDLAFVAVPASQVVSVTQQCIAKEVKAIVMISAGFSETGGQGKLLQDQVLELVQSSNVRLVGPNCLGIMNTDPLHPLNGSFGVKATKSGNIAICSQSGALGFVFPDYMQQWNLGVSSFVSIGNKLDVGENDLLAYWADDPATDVIQLYLESFQNPKAFRELACAISLRKPIVALKSGRTNTGRRAAGSHTAALASQDVAVDALFQQSGVIRANTLQELFEITAVLASQPLPSGRRVAVLTDAGGPGVLCADTLETLGLQVPALSFGLQEAMRKFLRSATTVTNPVDLIASTDPEEYRKCLQYLLESDEVDAVIVIFVARLAETSESIAKVIHQTALAYANEKTVLGVFMQSSGQPHALASTEYSVPSFQYPESAARALASAVQYADHRKMPFGRRKTFDDIQINEAERIIHNARRRSDSSRHWLPTEDVQALLRAFGITTPHAEIAHSADEAVAAFERIGSPVVLKVEALDVLHKSDVGGVELNCCDKQAVYSAYQRIIESTPSASRALVQEMVSAEYETIIGVTRDPQFGAQIAFGSGGTMVELMDDVVFRLAPLTDIDVDEMLNRTKMGRMLCKGFRNRRPGDVNALKDLLARVSVMVESIPEIIEMDLNPVMLLVPPRGVRIVDARISITTNVHLD
ncbi:MAG: acetate--CoA ligase family protein [Pirellula sp.]